MLIKPDSTTTNSTVTIPAATACGNCGAEERRLLHHVRHRGVFRRLCTTCVLRLHPQSFCPTCFEVYPPPPSNDAVLTCFKCYSSSHSYCVEAGPTSPPNPYICPLCQNPNAPIFKLKSAKEANLKIGEAMNARIEDCRVMDRDSAKKLLAAAKIASVSMNKAAVAAKAEAERRSKEAAFTRKRAKEALEHVAHLMLKEKARKKEGASTGPSEVTGPGFGGVGSNGVYIAPAVKMEREANVNVISNTSSSDRNGIAGFNAVEEKLSNVGNVDRDNSNQVLAALNAVELRENEKIGGGITSQGVGEGSGVSQSNDHALMDVDEMGSVGERINDSSSDLVNFVDMDTDAERHNTQGEKLENVGDEVILFQPVVQQMQYEKKSNGGEQHANGGSL